MSALRDILRQERELVFRFIACLNEETHLLREIKPDALSEVGRSKMDLGAELDQVENRRRKLLDLPAGQPGRLAMQTWLAAHPEESEAAGLWNEILTLAEEAKRLHALNGELIALHLRKTTEAIEILSQRQRDKPLYGSDGQSTGGGGNRIVDSA